jgi:hypothetical protein
VSRRATASAPRGGGHSPSPRRAVHFPETRAVENLPRSQTPRRRFGLVMAVAGLQRLTPGWRGVRRRLSSPPHAPVPATDDPPSRRAAGHRASLGSAAKRGGHPAYGRPPSRSALSVQTGSGPRRARPQFIRILRNRRRDRVFGEARRPNLDLVPADDLIETFDNDNTLWVEQPMHTQVLFALDRVKALSPGVLSFRCPTAPSSQFHCFFDSFGRKRRSGRVEPTGCPRPEPSSMPLDPRRVQAVFLAAAERHDPVDRAAILELECSTDLVLRRRVEALLRAHDEFNSFLNDPVDVTANPGRRKPLLSDYLWRLRRRSRVDAGLKVAQSASDSAGSGTPHAPVDEDSISWLRCSNQPDSGAVRSLRCPTRRCPSWPRPFRQDGRACRR